MADKKKKDDSKTPQDKHKTSAFTAAQDIAYRKYQNRKAAEGEKPLPKRQWYTQIYKK